eukprot:COSAG06_NODE_80_length_25388_cov_33.371545_25_plen_486_part_00
MAKMVVPRALLLALVPVAGISSGGGGGAHLSSLSSGRAQQREANRSSATSTPLNRSGATTNASEAFASCLSRSCAPPRGQPCPASHPIPTNPTTSGCCAFWTGPCQTCCTEGPPPPPPPGPPPIGEWQWSMGSKMRVARGFGAWVVLNNGSVVSMAGSDNDQFAGPATNVTEIYDPQSNEWSRVADMLGWNATQNRMLQSMRSATLLANGTVMACCSGGRSNAAFRGGYQLWDPAKDEWTFVPRPLRSRDGNCGQTVENPVPCTPDFSARGVASQWLGGGRGRQRDYYHAQWRCHKLQLKANRHRADLGPTERQLVGLPVHAVPTLAFWPGAARERQPARSGRVSLGDQRDLGCNNRAMVPLRRSSAGHTSKSESRPGPQRLRFRGGWADNQLRRTEPMPPPDRLVHAKRRAVGSEHWAVGGLARDERTSLLPRVGSARLQRWRQRCMWAAQRRDGGDAAQWVYPSRRWHCANWQPRTQLQLEGY